jgi:hypothetical protein
MTAAISRRQTAASAIIQQIENEIAAIDQDEKLFKARIIELEAEGYSIVDGEETVTDWRTKEVIGRFNPADMSGWSADWYHTDPIRDEIYELTETTKVKGLPDSLISDLRDWVGSHEEEARAWIAVVIS